MKISKKRIALFLIVLVLLVCLILSVFLVSSHKEVKTDAVFRQNGVVKSSYLTISYQTIRARLFGRTDIKINCFSNEENIEMLVISGKEFAAYDLSDKKMSQEYERFNMYISGLFYDGRENSFESIEIWLNENTKEVWINCPDRELSIHTDNGN